MRDEANALSAWTLGGIVFGALLRAATLLVSFGAAVVAGTLVRDALAGDVVICSGGLLIVAVVVMIIIALPAGIIYVFIDVALTITLLRRQPVARRLAIFIVLVGLTIVFTGAYFFATRSPTPPKPCVALIHFGWSSVR